MRSKSAGGPEEPVGGLWRDREVPKKGWVCTGISDEGEPTHLCEMCRSKLVRYVHRMTHADYRGDLAVGCVCAGKMEGDFVAAQGRESRYKNLLQRSKRWLKRRWGETVNGNPRLRVDGFEIIIFPKDGGWKYMVKLREEHSGEKPWWSKNTYSSVDEARMASCYGLFYVKEKLIE